MKPKTMILMGLAIVCGLGASYMTSRLLAERQPQEEERVEILVAKKNLSVGERITNPDDFFEKKAVVKNDEPPDAVKDPDAVKGKVMRVSRMRGDHVTPANLLDKNRLDIPDGHQAVGLPVNLLTTAHGLASLPNSRVDVILTVRGDVNTTFTKVVIENALVLAADGRVSPDGELIAPASVVTLALMEQDRLIALAAKEMGTLTLSLRKLDDSTRAKVDSIDGRRILRGSHKDEEPKPVVVEAPTPPKNETPKPEEPKGEQRSLVIVNGGNVQTTPYRQLESGEIRFDDGRPSIQLPPARKSQDGQDF
jgi:Flp pilus assembly protein CpaB